MGDREKRPERTDSRVPYVPTDAGAQRQQIPPANRFTVAYSNLAVATVQLVITIAAVIVGAAPPWALYNPGTSWINAASWVIAAHVDARKARKRKQHLLTPENAKADAPTDPAKAQGDTSADRLHDAQ